jgi:hypothetical protein
MTIIHSPSPNAHCLYEITNHPHARTTMRVSALNFHPQGEKYRTAHVAQDGELSPDL